MKREEPHTPSNPRKKIVYGAMIVIRFIVTRCMKIRYVAVARKK